MTLPSARLMLKPAQLQLIYRIAETGQLQHAAQICGMTQPAASRMLAKTEWQVGAALFFRRPNGMEPTEIGESVLRRARVILREIYSMTSEVTALRAGLAGSVRIGAVTGPAVNYLVSAVREIKQQTPHADITVDVMPSRELLAYLSAGEMDFVLARILPEFESRDFDITPIRDEQVSLMVRVDHPLARAQTVTMVELSEYEWVMHQRGSPIREAIMKAFASLGLTEPGNIVSSPSLLFTIAYLSRSDAVAPISDEVAQLLIAPPVSAGFRFLPLGRRLRVPPYYLLTLRRRPLSQLALRLKRQVIETSQDAKSNKFG